MAHFQDFLPKPTSWLSQFVMGRTIDSVRRRMKSLLLRIPMNSAKFVQEAMHKDLKSLEDFLQDKLFLMGPKVSNVDCTVFAFLFICSIEEPQLLQQCSFGSMYPNCLRYVKTLSQLYYDKHNAYTTQTNTNPDVFEKMAQTQWEFSPFLYLIEKKPWWYVFIFLSFFFVLLIGVYICVYVVVGDVC